MKNKLYNIALWIEKNVTSICLVIVFLISLNPFINDNHGHVYYTVLGGFFTFVSVAFFGRWNEKEGVKESNLYNILCVVIMILGISSLFILHSKMDKSPYSNFDLFFTTHLGGLMGLVLATFICDIHKEKQKHEVLKERVKAINKTKIKLAWISVEKELPKNSVEVLCRGKHGGYFVGTITKTVNNVGKAIYECNSGDDGMNNVVCWIYLTEIEFTIPEKFITK